MEAWPQSIPYVEEVLGDIESREATLPTVHISELNASLGFTQ